MSERGAEVHAGLQAASTGSRVVLDGAGQRVQQFHCDRPAGTGGQNLSLVRSDDVVDCSPHCIRRDLLFSTCNGKHQHSA